MKTLKLIFAAALALAAIIFALQNSENVMFSFLTWRMEAPRALILLATFIFGMFAGLLAALALLKPSKKEKSPTLPAKSLGKS